LLMTKVLHRIRSP